ncbi:Heterokaryon incompatibility protein (HET) domain containing protein [Rhypophila decipiens]
MSIRDLYSSTSLRTNHRDIRLLCLQPSTDLHSPIECTLQVVSLDPEPGPTKFLPPVYKALSYVWGDDSEANKRPILVNNAQVRVTLNLTLALRRLRAHHTKDLQNNIKNTSNSKTHSANSKDASDEPLVIWVDAVCINQSDNDERASQVPLMGRIYKSCSKVCVWLGPVGCEDVPICLNWDDLLASSSLPVGSGGTAPDIVLGLEQCARNFATLASSSFSSSSLSSPPDSANPTPTHRQSIHFSDLPPAAAATCINSPTHEPTTTGSSKSNQLLLGSSMTLAMRTLSNSPYFTRAWVVQEAHLSPSREIYFGHITLPSTALWTVHSNRKLMRENCTCCIKGEDPPSLSQATVQFLGKLISLAVVRDPVGLLVPSEDTKNGGLPHEVYTMPEMGILDFTIRRRGQECKDPRDKVYAYLGIVEDWLEIVLGLLGRTGLDVEIDYSVDYDEGETVESKAGELYLRLCCDAVNKGRSLEFLGWDTGKSNAFKGLLPSWALDWMYHGGAGSGEQMNMFDCFQWKANKGLKFDAGVVDLAGKKILVSKASKRVDKILKVGGLYGITEEACNNWHDITGLRETPDAGEKRYPNGKDLWGDAWWKALCFVSDDAQRRWRDKDIRALELVSAIVDNSHWNYLAKMKISRACSETLPVKEIVQSQEMMADLFKSSITPITGEMALRLQGRVLFVTERGYLGFGRAGIQKGDELFLLGGCKTPLIMRALEGKQVEQSVMLGTCDLKGEGLYELVTGAFVYGIMDGELLAKDDDLSALETICVM